MVKSIQLKNGHEVLVDDEDFEEISQHYWRASKSTVQVRDVYYAVRQKGNAGNRQTFLMHRVIMNAKKGEEIDHINGNGLDNRKSNLRKVTRRQNAQNQRVKRASRYIGVTYDKRPNIKSHWLARISIENKTHHLGAFKKEKDAAKRYDKALIDLGLDPVNFP